MQQVLSWNISESRHINIAQLVQKLLLSERLVLQKISTGSARRPSVGMIEHSVVS